MSSDTQWIVSNREDGQNVNGWHWVEKDVLPFLRDTLRSTLCGKPCCTAEGSTVVTVERAETTLEVTGEATANNRRGKSIYCYEVEVTIRWECAVPSDSDKDRKVTGSVHFPYVGEDNEDEDYEAKVKCNSSTLSKKEQDDLVDEIRRQAVPFFRTAIKDVISQMKQKYACHPSTTKSAAASAPTATTSPSPAPVSAVLPPPPATTPAGKDTVIRMSERFIAATPKVIYELLLDGSRLTALTGGAKTDPCVGGEFMMFSGAVMGSFTELVCHEDRCKVVMRWRFANWALGHFSTVTIDIYERGGRTQLDLEQVNVPKEDLERTEQGWRDNFWSRARLMFGLGGESC